MKKILLLPAMLLASFVYAQETPPEEVPDLSLEELMNIKISVSKTDLSLRETPSIITVMTREEIRNMGARDLMDVLKQVPGFTFGVDVQNVVGLGARGNWGHEGKILLLIDGQEMNEIIFSTTQFGQHYDINNIERIEVIRGPGSSIYGGYAELGVINIITRNGSQLKGVTASGQFGTTSNAIARSNFSFALGNATEKVDYAISGWMGKGIRSDQNYTDIFGTTVDLTKRSDFMPFMLNAGVKVGSFSGRVIYDDYTSETIDQFDAIIDLNRSDVISFRNLFAELKYDYKLSESISITPKINFKDGSPWVSSKTAVVPYLVDSRRISPSVNVDWKINDNTAIVAGVDSYIDKGEYTGDDADYFGDLSEDNSISFNNIGVFAQGTLKSAYGIFTVGSRFDSHSQFGTAFSPRVGYTKTFNNLHVKAMYSRAFRAPALENMNYNPDVEPERTGVAEIEVGYKFNSNIFVTGNIFHIQIDDPIVYFVDEDNPVGTYDNFEKSGSKGFELDFRAKYDWGYINLNYSYYSSKDMNEVPYYQVPGEDDVVIGLPGGRLNGLASFKICEGFSVNPSANILGKRYAVSGVDDSDNYIFKSISTSTFVNIFLNYTKDNFNIGAGVFDIADEGEKFVQPYASGHAVLPGLGREFTFRLSYTVPFK